MAPPRGPSQTSLRDGRRSLAARRPGSCRSACRRVSASPRRPPARLSTIGWLGRTLTIDAFPLRCRFAPLARAGATGSHLRPNCSPNLRNLTSIAGRITSTDWRSRPDRYCSSSTHHSGSSGALPAITPPLPAFGMELPAQSEVAMPRRLGGGPGCCAEQCLYRNRRGQADGYPQLRLRRLSLRHLVRGHPDPWRDVDKRPNRVPGRSRPAAVRPAPTVCFLIKTEIRECLLKPLMHRASQPNSVAELSTGRLRHQDLCVP